MKKKAKSELKQTRMTFPDIDLACRLFGEHNGNLNTLANETEIKINARGEQVFLDGDSIGVDLAENILNQLYGLLKDKYPIYPADMDHAIRILKSNHRARLKDIFMDSILITTKNKSIVPKSSAQKNYVDAIRSSDLVFGIGPAGTGKTYLAMAMAVSALKQGSVERIILTRPAVEAGENLGFLPGDLAEKIDPYLRPLYDALYDMMHFEKASSLMAQGTIEVAPIAFMRGRTLNDSFIILDEAQNTSAEQMKMFLTRIGFNSQAVVTGDITQIDLPPQKESGLIQAKRILRDIDGISFAFFSEKDVIRHKLVQKIIQAYEKSDQTLGSARQ